MSRPNFSLTWASSRPSIPAISGPDYALGFANYLGSQPPTTDDHDYIMNLQDRRAVWLGEQMLLAVGHEWQSDVSYNLQAYTRSPVNGKIYKSLDAANTGNEPSANPLKWKEVPDLSAGSSLPLGYFSGFNLANNSGAPNTTIDVAAGSARSSANNADINLTGTLRGILQASGAWAAGDNQSKLDAGARANNTWYHVFAIRGTSNGTADILFSLSATAPTMPSGYAGFRRIGAVKTDGSGNILAFTNVGDEFIWKTLPLDVSVTTSTDADYVISAPLGVRVLVRVGLFCAGGDSFVTIRPTDSTAYVPSYTAYIGGNVGVSAQTPEYFGSEMTSLTDTLGRIRVTAPAAAVPSSVRVVTYSYKEIGR